MSGLNSDLIAYLKKPEIMLGLFKYVEEPSDVDEFARYKAPYQAAECIACFPHKDLLDVAQDEEVVKGLFSMIEGKSMDKT